MAPRHAARARAPTEAYSSTTTTTTKSATAAKASSKHAPPRQPAAPPVHDSSEDEDETDTDDDDDGPQPFPFFSLPAEIRLRVYELLLLIPGGPIDLSPTNYRLIRRRTLPLFLTSRRTHDEAYRVFYGSNTFRLFPLHGRFFHTKRPLLARLPPRYRAAIATLELRLGPGWQGPLPKCWDLSPAGAAKLGLADCSGLRALHVFVECDPASDEVFRGFRRSDDFFTSFCGSLLGEGLLPRVPSVAVVRFDGFPSVKTDSPLMVELLRQVRLQGRRITYGPERGWGREKGVEELEKGVARLRLWAGATAQKVC